jgi:ABC-type lipoprotein export system ATPase subunit
MLQARNLHFSYNKTTSFQFPDMEVKSGEILLITGKSGKGKTTLLHLLGGILKPNNGEININNTTISHLTESKLDAFRGSSIGIVFQKSHFVASLSILENLKLASWLAYKSENEEVAKETLIRLGLESELYKKPSELSIGQQQRANIARAIINNPKLILADEPTSSLDDENTEIVFHLLKESALKCGAALVIVTHDQRLKDKVNKIIELK